MEAIILGAIRFTAVSDSVPKIANVNQPLYLTASLAIRHNVFICTSWGNFTGNRTGCTDSAPKTGKFQKFFAETKAFRDFAPYIRVHGRVKQAEFVVSRLRFAMGGGCMPPENNMPYGGKS